MKSTSKYLLLLALAVPVIALAESSVQPDADKFICGDAEVTVHSNCLSFPEQERQCKTQSLQLHNASKGISRTLQHAGKPIRQPFVHEGQVLDAIATGWACVKSKSGISYVYVMYTCVENDNDPQCAGTDKEWEMLYGLDGKNFTKAIPRRGSARAKELERIYRRLGLQDTAAQPLQLQGVKY